ncbi:NUDIX domain-containing protein [Halobacillus halophilus]|uniref:NUDIX hydrolase n=1 Tax=Halobacillus halophilus TaxID=1570 RepID=UPI001367D5C5|nr:NUDIX domain-containing protein [Halobacillus halophilus]MYL29731.1 NUDIX domain-containing protein [Halobacillus halophilus]
MDVRFRRDGRFFNHRAAGILIEQGHVLLHKQKKDAHWALPGGGIELGEDSMNTIIREVREELGWEVEVERTVWIAESFFPHRGEALHEVAFYYALETKEPKFRAGPFHGKEGGHLSYQWVALDDLSLHEVKPAFLKKALLEIPDHLMHLILKETF